ncbi:alpha/beta fold hydrolase [Paenibacillus tarimensis]
MSTITRRLLKLMQQAITLNYEGKTLRGMEHIPAASQGPLPAVIMFHGFTGTKLGSHRFFLKISRQLEKLGYAVFRYDFYGSGESDGDFEEMTVSGELADANAILDQVRADPRIDNSRISVIGFSMGGLIASVLAGDRPDDIDRLILLAPAGIMKELIKAAAGDYLASSDAETFDWGGNLIGRAFSVDLETFDVFGRSKAFQKDVLLIHGTEDKTVPAAVSQMYKEQVYGDRARIHYIANCDHNFNSHAWESELIEQIGQFMGRA